MTGDVVAVDQVLDTMRFIALMEGGVVLGLALFVVRLYHFARGVMIRRGEEPIGASPYHVSVIATSHLLMVAAMMIVIYTHLGEEFVWYVTPVAIVSFTLSIVGLVELLRYEDSRVKRKLTTRGGTA